MTCGLRIGSIFDSDNSDPEIEDTITTSHCENKKRDQSDSNNYYYADNDNEDSYSCKSTNKSTKSYEQTLTSGLNS